MTDNRPTLSIIILSWNTRRLLCDCLESVYQNTKAVDFEVIVVDNGSTDGTVDAVRTNFPTARLIVNESNLGTSRAANQGMAAARGEFLLLLNSDTFIREDLFSKSVGYLRSRPDVSMLGIRLEYPDGRLQHSANRALSIWRSLFEELWLYKLVPSAVRDEMLLGGFWAHDREVEVDWLAGPFTLLRREVFESVGGLAEDLFMHGEDCEWGMRIRKSGRKITYNPLGVVYHIGSASQSQRWTNEQILRLCHFGGLWAYERTNGPLLGFAYHCARLFGTSVRYGVYRLLCAVKTSDYYRHQLGHYSCLVRAYVGAFVGMRAARRAQQHD
jgi:hypothetical protein